MAAQKRKNEAAAEKRPEKKQKAERKAPAATATSVLRQEEVAFPRGGGSILTPLERKQIQIQARQDVLFEQSTGGKAPEAFDSEDEENGPTDGGVAPKSKARKEWKKSKAEVKHKKNPGREHEESGLRIEGLGYKRLAVGSVLLGQVMSINKYDVTVALPNNLIGFLPLTAISNKVTQTVEALAAEEDEENEGNDEEPAQELQLQDFVRIGQYLRVFVSAIGQPDRDTSKERNKRHITLSANPEQANGGLGKADLIVNSIFQAAVESVEDHGLIMSLGLDDTSVKGFISSKELPPNLQLSQIKAGAVMLCLITGLSSNGKIIKLSANTQKVGNVKKAGFLTDAPSIDAFLPGTAVEFMVSDTSDSGIAGKVMGLLDVTADYTHTAAYSTKKPLAERYPVGSKAKARILCTFPTSSSKKLGVSLLPHIVGLSMQTPLHSEVKPTDKLPISAIIGAAKVAAVEPGVGIFMDIGVKGVYGFAHISRLSDEKISTISESTGTYKVGSVHKARVLSFNAIDGLFILSLEKAILEAPFLRLEDIKAGEVVNGNIEKLTVNGAGSTSILLKLSDNIVGLVPEMHLSEMTLRNPERKFQVGQKVKARVLNVDLDRRRIRLTLKRNLIVSDSAIWKSYDDPAVGAEALGTIVNLTSAGAVVQFYGSVRGFLPVSQMSESFVEDPQKHFRLGQTVNTHVLSIDIAEGRMTLSCRDQSIFAPEQQKALAALQAGTFVSGVVSEKSPDKLVIDLAESNLKATLRVDQLADGSAKKCQDAAQRIRVEQTLRDLLVLDKNESKRTIELSNKPSLIKAARSKTLPSSLDQLEVGQELAGFVRNITQTAIFVQFASSLVGLLPRNQISDEILELPEFGLRKYATIAARVLSIDAVQERFLLTQKKLTEPQPTVRASSSNGLAVQSLENPIDETITALSDFHLGSKTKAKITSVKETQLNVLLADGVQGRIDVSEIFDGWDEIKDRKHPLRKFNQNQVLPVRILGMHDHRNHRFLPISHIGKAPVFELTARPSDLSRSDLNLLTYDKVLPGSEHLCFVNNVGEGHLWVNITPNVRGRIQAIDLSDDVSLLSKLSENFPVGSALRARVLSVDAVHNKLDLSARTSNTEAPKTISDLSEGMIIPAKVTRVSERQIMVQVSETLSGPVHLVDMADDFAKADPTSFEKNQIIRVYVLAIDAPNKKLTLSTRPSKVLSSSLSIADPEIKSVKQLKVNDVVRGFVKNVADNGIFIALSSSVTAFVRVSNLSDRFIKDWKAEFEVDQLVRGKAISVDQDSKHVSLSLKESVITDENYTAPITYHDLRVGQNVTGKVRKVEDFGVFIVVDNSANVSGLCHRSEIADEKISDVKALYDQGDAVKAKVLRIDLEKRRVAFGLKASYFQDERTVEVDSEHSAQGDDSDIGVDLLNAPEASNDIEFDASNDELTGHALGGSSDTDQDSDGGISICALGAKDLSSNFDAQADLTSADSGLNVGPMDWSGGVMDDDRASDSSDLDSDQEQSKKKRRKTQIQVDRTAELDINGPQSTADFERLLMSDPNSSPLWLQYMAFYLQVQEVSQAREIAERAIKTVNHQSSDTEEDALNIWVGYLNLENTYGTEDSLRELFVRATQFNDSEEIHNRLASIYIQSEKHDAADELFQGMVRRFSQDPKVWLNYATFLFDTASKPVSGRDLLPRALQALPKHHHFDLTVKFAQLEFRSPNGDSERGRTMFEGLMNTFPKRLDLYNVLLDLEQKAGDKERVRRLFQRATAAKLKPKQARFFFKRWLEYEEKEGDSKKAEKVKARAAEFARKHQEKQLES